MSEPDPSILRPAAPASRPASARPATSRPESVRTEPARPSHPLLPWLAALGVVCLWASSFIVIRAGGAHFSPGPMALLRAGSAALTLAPLALTGRIRLPRSGRVLAGVLAWGVAWFAAYMVVLNAAERSIDAATAAMLVNIAPLIVAVVSGLLFGEGLGPRLIAGITVAFGGIVLITVATSSGHVSAVGLLLGFVAALLYAGCVLLQKPLLAHVDSLSMTTVGIAAGAVACLPFAPGLLGELSAAPAASIASMLYLGVVSTALAYLLWGYALTHTSAGVLSSSSLVIPAVTVLMAWLILGEVPPPLAALGGALCLAGAAFAVGPSVLASLRWPTGDRETGDRPAEPAPSRAAPPARVRETTEKPRHSSG